jgi:hypothetical protein
MKLHNMLRVVYKITSGEASADTDYTGRMTVNLSFFGLFLPNAVFLHVSPRLRLKNPELSRDERQTQTHYSAF